MQRNKAAATRAGLIGVARSQFAESGYHGTVTNDLVVKAGVTRGALYYHFADKVTLFEAVFREVITEVSQTAAGSVAKISGDTWRQLIESLQAYLELIAGRPDLQRIILVDGPAVLGWKLWREILSEYILNGLAITLQMLMDKRIIEQRRTEPLAHLIMAALNDAALSIAHAADQAATLADASDALIVLIKGLKIPSP